jgi:hypothetical protein
VQLIEIVNTADNNPLRLSFTVRCRITDNAKELNLVFDTVFGKMELG